MDITRRDYLGGTLLGAGALLLGDRALAASQPDGGLPTISAAEAARFNGPAGVGDYARANGNTWQVISRAHMLRDGAVPDLASAHLEDGGEYDVIMVGGGASSMGAAYRLTKERGGKVKGLILENHPIFGGEARQNEFEVDGHRIFGPQGSNLITLPKFHGERSFGVDPLFDEYTDIGLPLDYEFVKLTGTDKPLEADRSNYLFQWGAYESDSIGMFGKAGSLDAEPPLLRNPWVHKLEGLGFAEPFRQDLLRWRFGLLLDRPREGLEPWLDSMTYQQLLVDVHKLSPEVARYTDLLLASAGGLGADAWSALVATRNAEMPGAALKSEPIPDTMTNPYANNITKFCKDNNVVSFPGGNSFVYRYFARALWPNSIQGDKNPENILSNPIRFDQLDVPGVPIRMRLGATALDVRHIGQGGEQRVRVIYAKDGRLYKATAKSAIMCCGAWVNRHIVADAPENIQNAIGAYRHSSVMVINVALRNWRFLEKLGITAATYQDGELGFSCNIRQPVKIGSYSPPFDPNKPIVLTFYAPLVRPSLPVAEQAAALRWELVNMSYRDIEQKIIRQMNKMFKRAGFDADRDIAGIIVNRQGHAYAVPQPGLIFPKDGSKSPPNVLREGYDRIFFAHAEYGATQLFVVANAEGQRAARQVLETI